MALTRPDHQYRWHQAKHKWHFNVDIWDCSTCYRLAVLSVELHPATDHDKEEHRRVLWLSK
eukprot:4231848-Amphidinium_carterae.1